MRIAGLVNILFLLVLFTSCNEAGVNGKSQKNFEDDILDITNMVFDSNYKTFYVDVAVKDKHIHGSVIDIDSIDVKVRELTKSLELCEENAQPIVVNISDIKAQQIKNLGLNAVVLVDLTLDKESIIQQKSAIKNLKRLFAYDNLYVSFIKDKEVSQTMLVTDYVIDNYFVPSNSEKKLYRAVLSKIDELNGKKSKYYSKVKQDTTLAKLDPSKKVMIVFSDGKTYYNNRPIDGSHFDLQHEIINKTAKDVPFALYYCNFKQQESELVDDDMFEDDGENEAEAVFSILCSNTNGDYFSHFNLVDLSKEILSDTKEEFADFRFFLTNPDNKVYRGLQRFLVFECYYKDSLFASGHKLYRVGNVYHPVIVNGKPIWKIVVIGIVMFLLLLMFIYIVFQFIIPYLRYLQFKKNYIVSYVGNNMSVNNMQVANECYYCKAPFEKGDKVIVKCEHTMHKECWEENEHKCPEYGRKCKDGSHYYNSNNLFDAKNPSFYMKWIIAGAVAGSLAWLFFIYGANNMTNDVVPNIILDLFDLESESAHNLEIFDKYGRDLFYPPYWGFYISAFLTLFLSAIASHGKWWFKRIGVVVSKSVLSGICGALTFIVINIMAVALELRDKNIIIDWLPWAANGFIIAFAVSYGTDIKLRKALFGATVAIVFGIGSMFIWKYAQDTHVDTRDLLMFSNIIYSVGLAVSLAAQSPRSERYFLQVEGPIKKTDIALYKWMNSQVCNRKVTIGKSVDCNLQMSWDINNAIAPVHAEILSHRGNIYLFALEPGVTKCGDNLRTYKKIRLYHGDTFKIGDTKFTYIERDV